jgi:trk system potassium uptake protein TrkH
MKIRYKNRAMETFLTFVTLLTAVVIAATFVLLYGFYEPLMSAKMLHSIQIITFLLLIAEKLFRFFNAFSKRQFLQANWFEIPLLLLLIIVIYGADTWFAAKNPGYVKTFALGVYLITQVVIKTCRSCVELAASGRNPTKTLVISFLVLIIAGAGMLMLPRSHNLGSMSLVDALFTATSATCVTGLIVKDTGNDFTLMGQTVILTLIQLGGLGIVVFGAVLALLLRQALSVRESVAMQDLLSTQTLGRISNIIGFIFVTTIAIETIGAICMFNMWDEMPGAVQNVQEQWFCSIFHSISAFCNAGFGLFNDSLISYNKFPAVYTVIAPLIILGGLGFGVLYNIADVAFDRMKRLFKVRHGFTGSLNKGMSGSIPKKIRLQTKIVVLTSFMLIIVGALALIIFEQDAEKYQTPILQSALFQSVTARTAGFNTINISSMSAANKLILMVLMFIGGSPVSTAGGIKTVTLTVLVMAVYATLHKRRNVEIFKRTISPDIVGRAVTVTLLFAAILLLASLTLSVTEKQNAFEFGDIMFETASALGTVGLTTGITSSLTAIGKSIIIIVMLIGRLGPLTLLAAMTFNLRTAGYDYPSEPIVVG